MPHGVEDVTRGDVAPIFRTSDIFVIFAVYLFRTSDIFVIFVI